MGGGQHGFRDRVPKHSPAQTDVNIDILPGSARLVCCWVQEKASLQSGLWLSTRTLVFSAVTFVRLATSGGSAGLRRGQGPSGNAFTSSLFT